MRVEVLDKAVGHLSRSDAVTYRRKYGTTVGLCDALIVGGWRRSDGDEGHYGVKLDFVL